MGKTFRNQFSRKAFTLQHEKRNEFVISSWQKSKSPVPLLLVRFTIASLITAIWLWSLLSEGPTVIWLIYLTNWGLMLLILTTWSAVVVSFSALCVRFPDSDITPWFFRWYWFLYNITTPTAFLITIFYWAILFNSETVDLSSEGFWLDVCTHGFNSLAMLIELVVSRTPSRFFHFYQPFGFGVWYVIFSAVYYSAGGKDGNDNTYIYDVLDWSNPGAAMAVVGCTAAGLLALHVAVVLLSVLRTSVSSNLVRRKGHGLPIVAEHITAGPV